eukprot:CAMPEP_0177692786 /NCGR_PEP_ID=MMETSP0484_2-20121128/2045_1 /TAXON_ID=354590 /ORGANISM="Rhodomonas lens, Strain RHODO" /LENGTH=330 /DNA_ID=CAMNT_0019203539 /DNA_START=70 /DNA_END=1061 /DNA_ORIENTATION=+
MASLEDALAAFKELESKIETAISSVKTPGNHRARPGEDPREALMTLGQKFEHDAIKLSMMYSDGKPPKMEDSIGLAEYVQKDTDQFLAWCNAVQNESPVMKREVEEAAMAMLEGMKNIVHLVIEKKFKEGPSSRMVGEQIMSGHEKLKKISKNEAQGVQKEVLKDAAAVKTVLVDVKEMLENAATHAMEDMGLEEGGAGDMDVGLDPEETKVVEACVVMVEACMAVLKASVRVIAAKLRDQAAAPTDQQPLPYETLAQASKVFTRGAEDLGALCVLDQSQCKPTAGVVLGGLEQACKAIAEIGGSKEGVEEHVKNAEEALGKAKAAKGVL